MAFDAMLQQRIVRCIATGVTLVTGRYWEQFSGSGRRVHPSSRSPWTKRSLRPSSVWMKRLIGTHSRLFLVSSRRGCARVESYLEIATAQRRLPAGREVISILEQK